MDKPIDPERFNAWIGVLLQEKGQDLLRTKGILSYAGDDRRFAFQAVHMIADGDFIGPWKPRRGAQPASSCSSAATSTARNCAAALKAAWHDTSQRKG